jgi:hypothetical protein
MFLIKIACGILSPYRFSQLQLTHRLCYRDLKGKGFCFTQHVVYNGFLLDKKYRLDPSLADAAMDQEQLKLSMQMTNHKKTFATWLYLSFQLAFFSA